MIHSVYIGDRYVCDVHHTVETPGVLSLKERKSIEKKANATIEMEKAWWKFNSVGCLTIKYKA